LISSFSFAFATTILPKNAALQHRLAIAAKKERVR